MDDREPGDRDVPANARTWTWVALASVATLPFALFLAFAGWLWTPAFAAGEPHPGQGTVLWAVSSFLLVAGFVLAPGPARPRRLALGAVAAGIWFVVGRFVLSAG